MNTLLVYLLGIGTGWIISRVMMRYVTMAEYAERKALLMGLVKLRRRIEERSRLLEDEIKGMKR